MSESVPIDHDRQAKARRYAITKRMLGVVDLVIVAALIGVLVASGFAVMLRDALSVVPGGRLGIVAAYFLVLSLGFAIVTMPLSLCDGWWLPRHYGISVQSFRSWLRDLLVAGLIALALGLVVVEAVYALLVAAPTTWWLIAGALYLFLVVVLANLGPILLVPLFYKMTPLERSPLTERLEEIARGAGTRVQGVYRMGLSAKTTAANAALMGLGNTRRIVLGDTLLDGYTPTEIEAVFAHELGHQVHQDVPKLVAVQSAVTLVGLYLASLALRQATRLLGYDGIADVATMPLLAAILGAFGVVTGPILNAYSRYVEVQADEYALATTGDCASFADAMRRLANQNLAEVDPPRWIEVIFYDHPSIGSRVRRAEQWRKLSREARRI